MARLPTLETCNQDDPKECYQWAFIAMPFHGSTPFNVEDALRPEWSQQLWDLGFRHHPELMVKKFRAPFRGQQHALNNSGAWVDLDDPEPDPVALPDVTEFTRHEQEVIAEQLRQEGVIHAEKSVVDVAVAVSAAAFDPSEHSPSTVNGYLMGVADAEKRRVVALEMTGKGRDQILRKWRGV